MSERYLRLILVGVMLVTLWLPYDPGIGSTCLYILWVLMESLEAGSYYAPVALAVPILILANFWLAVYPTKYLKTVYRVTLWVLFPFVLFETLMAYIFTWRGHDPGPSIGFWAKPVMVTVAAVLELALIWRRPRKPENAGE